jgi:hypothetical protein
VNKIALVFLALFVVSLMAVQNASKRKHIHPIVTFSSLAGVCLILAILFFIIAFLQGQNI